MTQKTVVSDGILELRSFADAQEKLGAVETDLFILSDEMAELHESLDDEAVIVGKQGVDHIRLLKSQTRRNAANRFNIGLSGYTENFVRPIDLNFRLIEFDMDHFDVADSEFISFFSDLKTDFVKMVQKKYHGGVMIAHFHEAGVRPHVNMLYY